MILNKISILNYRNIEEANLEFSNKINCLIGHNGVGKTNMLDAIFFLSFCKSAHNSIDSQVIKHDKDFFVLEGTYTTDDDDTEKIFCGVKRGSKKKLKRNQKDYKKLAEHIGLIPLVMVSPADTALIDGPAEERRRHIDMVIAQYDREYIYWLITYNKCLTQRNALLKQEEEPDMALMEILEQQMAESGEKIYRKRNEFITHITPLFQEIYQMIADGHEQVSLNYVSHCQRGPLLDVIQRDRERDRAVGYSLHGIHRDDIDMLIGGFPMRREGSQGQCKSYVIALKLAQFRFLRQTAGGRQPILLLDDIFDKLDARRVERLISLVASDEYGQIFITDTNREHLDQILQASSPDYKIFSVTDGNITET
ncbi:MAG: DNA replication and repair protein RecF [Prevotella sp.]|nr:DNA replication and repair protein RecF [Prevotella sp.]